VSERTLVLVKPDGVRRGLVGEIIGRFERKGFALVALELRSLARETAEAHYDEHRSRPFFAELVDFITGGPLVAIVLEGPGAVLTVRSMMGTTNPAEADSGTIRGDFGLEIAENLVHGSDSLASAKREIALFFPHIDP